MNKCLYCRAGHHELHNQSVRFGQSIPDVLACKCDDPIFHKPKEMTK